MQAFACFFYARKAVGGNIDEYAQSRAYTGFCGWAGGLGIVKTERSCLVARNGCAYFSKRKAGNWLEKRRKKEKASNRK
jgi:hypothetical protein